VRSIPFRVRSLIDPAPATMATNLWPSCLTSRSQLSPRGGSEAAETIFGRILNGKAAGTAADGNNRSGIEIPRI